MLFGLLAQFDWNFLAVWGLNFWSFFSVLLQESDGIGDVWHNLSSGETVMILVVVLLVELESWDPALEEMHVGWVRPGVLQTNEQSNWNLSVLANVQSWWHRGSVVIDVLGSAVVELLEDSSLSHLTVVDELVKRSTGVQSIVNHSL